VLIDMGGQAVARAMLESRPGGQKVFVMGTAADRAQIDERAAVPGLAGCVTKPTTPSSLLDDLLAGIGATPLGGRVLVVEDNEINRIVASELISAHGVEVSTVNSATEALSLLASGERFDLVFMDVQMPGMDGFEATRSLRALPQGASFRIIAMTAHAMAGDRERCLAAGMDDYIAKHLSPAALAAALRRWLGRGATASSSVSQ
jgi:two-component system, sensor histidine kinase and response regulator